MSRIANAPVVIPKGVEVNLNGNALSVKGSNGALDFSIHEFVSASIDDGVLNFKAKTEDRPAVAMAGTMRALANNMVTGVSEGFTKKLELVGVGYRAQVQGKKLNLTLGFSHPVEYDIPEGITVECPSQTEILVKGADKQKVGQVSAEIRAWRPPEPYKGKGVRYADEHIVRKEAKKK
jgi:large subunit ribosomal protein L6